MTVTQASGVADPGRKIEVDILMRIIGSQDLNPKARMTTIRKNYAAFERVFKAKKDGKAVNTKIQ